MIISVITIGVQTMIIRKAVAEDLNDIFYIYEHARLFMLEAGNPNQWGSVYPDKKIVVNDLNSGSLYVGVIEETISCVFCFFVGEEPTYKVINDGSWLNDDVYGVIHRVAVAHGFHGKGIVSKCFDFCCGFINNLRIDTHAENYPMQKALSKYGFIKCGKIMVSNGERLAFQFIGNTDK